MYAKIYPPAIQGLADKESIQDKWELTIRCINGMQSAIDGMRSKTLWFEHHSTIENTLVKLKAIYNPLKKFGHQFLPGYKIPRSHETTSFTMNYREYHQRELYLLLSDIFWLTLSIKSKFVYDCIMYKRLDLLICIVSKSSKILQWWAITYDLYMWHLHY